MRPNRLVGLSSRSLGHNRAPAGLVLGSGHGMGNELRSCHRRKASHRMLDAHRVGESSAVRVHVAAVVGGSLGDGGGILGRELSEAADSLRIKRRRRRMDCETGMNTQSNAAKTIEATGATWSNRKV